MSTATIAIQTLIIAVAIQAFASKDIGIVLAFFAPGAVFVAELLYFSFVSPYQGGGASMFFPALLLWAIPISMLGFSVGHIFWWLHNRINAK